MSGQETGTWEYRLEPQHHSGLNHYADMRPELKSTAAAAYFLAKVT